MKAMLMFAGWIIITSCAMAQPRISKGHSFPKVIHVSYYKTTLLVFGAGITSADRGSADIIASPFEKAPHVLRVKATKEHFEPTNLSIYTQDGMLFTVTVLYDENPNQTRYDFTNSFPPAVGPATSVVAGRMSEAAIQDYARHIPYLKTERKRPTDKNHGVRINLRSIYVRDGVLFFSFTMTNSTDIPFNVDFLRFYQRDRSQAKRTSVMEKELRPLYVHFSGGQVASPGKSISVVAAFETFTIADGKSFIIELFEKNGDRHLSIRLKGKHILKAIPLITGSQEFISRKR